MAPALDAFGQRAKRTRTALELGLRMVPARPRRDLSRQHRRVAAQQHLPNVDLGKPDPAGRGPDCFLDDVGQALRAALRIHSCDGHGVGADLLRRFPACLSRSPRHPCLRADGFVFRHRMGRCLLGEARGRCGHHRAQLAQASAPRDDFFRREWRGGDLDQRAFDIDRAWHHRHRCGGVGAFHKAQRARRLRPSCRAVETLGAMGLGQRNVFLSARVFPFAHGHAPRGEPPVLRAGMAWRRMDDQHPHRLDS